MRQQERASGQKGGPVHDKKMAGTLSVNIFFNRRAFIIEELKPLLIFSWEMITENPPAVLIIVTIDAEVFPVGAIRRIISGVAVFMVDSQKMPVFGFKLPSAFGTDEPVYFKRLFPVITWGSRDLF